MTAMRLKPLTTAREHWAQLSQENTAKSVYAQNNLQQTFFDMHCAKGGDVRTFLQTLSHKWEELAAAGVPVSDAEYQRTILHGIPDDLAQFTSQLLASSHLTSPFSSVNNDILIIHICKEVDRTHNRHNCGQSDQGYGKKDQQPDEALAATGSNVGKKNHHKGKCHYCQKEGHWERECWKKLAEQGSQAAQTSGSTPAKSETKPVGAANTVTGDDVEGDGFFMAIKGELTAHTIGADPDPYINPDASWDVNNHNKTSVASADWLQEGEDLAAMSITPVEEGAVAHVELFDSGASHHISPYRDDFTTYTPLAPTENKQCFQAVGTGSLAIRVPNGGSESNLTLHNTLHTPAVAYTLVSLGMLDSEGYTMAMAT
jgi:gag-polypeptide of LTR copia-type